MDDRQPSTISKTFQFSITGAIRNDFLMKMAVIMQSGKQKMTMLTQFTKSKHSKILSGVWLILALLLFPFSPIQFSNLSADFYRAWSFELLPDLLLVMVTCLNLVSARDFKKDLLMILIPTAIFTTILAIWNLGTQVVVFNTDKKENIFCVPKQIINTNFGTVMFCESFDWVHYYFEVRQEWSLVPGLKFVRYIDRFTDPPPMHILVNNRTVELHYDGDLPSKHTELHYKKILA